MIGSFRGGFAFLSNFFEYRVILDDISYPSAEHAYQAQKAQNPEDFAHVLRAYTPAHAKHLGRMLPLPSDWGTRRLDVMRRVVDAKFGEPDLARKLAKTKGYRLVHGNTHRDTFWGAVLFQGDWCGHNWLGRLIEDVRDGKRES